MLCGRTEESCSMVNSLRKVDFSHPTGHYTWKKFRPSPPLEKILGAPLMVIKVLLTIMYSSDLAPNSIPLGDPKLSPR